MIKTKFGFFQAQIDSMFRHAVELCQMSFCKAPERFSAVKMLLTPGKFIVAMISPEMLIKANINIGQSVIATLPLRMNHGILYPEHIMHQSKIHRFLQALQRRFKLAVPGNPLPHFKVNGINRSNRDIGQMSVLVTVRSSAR